MVNEYSSGSDFQNVKIKKERRGVGLTTKMKLRFKSVDHNFKHNGSQTLSHTCETLYFYSEWLSIAKFLQVSLTCDQHP